MSRPLRPPGPDRSGGRLSSLQDMVRFVIDGPGLVGQRFEAFGDVYFVPGPDGGLYVLRHPDHIHQVLARQAGDFTKEHTALARLGIVLGQGLLTSDGETWRRHRRMIQPAFRRDRLSGLAELTRQEAQRTASAWQDGQVIDLSTEMMALTLRIVCRALFSHGIDEQAIRKVGHTMEELQAAALSPGLLPTWLPGSAGWRVGRANDLLDEVIHALIAHRRAQPTEQQPDDLLQVLLDARDSEGEGTALTEQEVRDHLVTFFLAGHETTSHALTWALVELHQHAQAADRIAAEAADAGPDTPLVWTRQVFDETLRLHPPAYLVARRARVDTTIGQWTVPAGSEVVAWLYHTQRDPRWWPDPLAFQPERFAHASALPPHAYLPFGLGPRGCIGKHFALLEGTCALATLARDWRLELVGPPPKGKARVTLSPGRVTVRTVRR